MSEWYRLVGKAPVLIGNMTDLIAYGGSWAPVDHTVIADVIVSTVFLGLDHRRGADGPPILFETMVFGGALNGEQERYSTWEEAQTGHDAMVARVKGEKP